MAKNEHHGGPVDRLNLLTEIVMSDWSTRLDHKVAAVIVSRYFNQFGNARASLRFIQKQTGATRPNVITSIERITTSGAITVQREGCGNRPTEYALNFRFLRSGIADDTSDRGIVDDTSTDISGTACDTSSGIVDNTSTGSSGIVHNTKTHLRNVLTSTVTYRNASAPHALGLSASAAGAGLVEVVSAEVDSKDGETILHVHAADEAGQRHTISVTLESRSEDTQRDGQRVLARLGEIAGKEIQESEDLFGVKLFIDWDGDLLPPDDEDVTRTAA